MTELGEDVLGQLDDSAEEYGISRGDVIQLHRAVLVVEGRQDEAVIDRFYDREGRTRR